MTFTFVETTLTSYYDAENVVRKLSTRRSLFSQPLLHWDVSCSLAEYVV